ncbi:MAG: DnaD domain protein [Chloroflexota bacterium]
MKQFGGFPAKMEFTPVPNLFFSSLLAGIDDMGELKTTLHLFEVLYRKRGYPRFISYGELCRHRALMNSLKGPDLSAEEVLRGSLGLAVRRGTVLHLVVDRDGAAADIYFLNTEESRGAIARIQSGELELKGLRPRGAYVELGEEPDIFTLYEQNVGMITPMIAEELCEAEKLYPVGWIRDAIKEAVSLNKRNWRYIARILESWSSQGRADGTHRRDTAQKQDPDKYIKGKYGHMVRR